MLITKSAVLTLGTTANSGSVGNLWYDTATCKIQYSTYGLGAASWTAGGALITARYALGGAGTQDAGLAFGGLASPTSVACTEEYTAGTVIVICCL